MQRIGNHIIFDIDDMPIKVMVCHRCLYEDDIKVDIEGCGICFRCGCGGWNTDLQGVEPTKIDFRNLQSEAWRLQAENNRLREEIDPLFMDVEIPTFEQAKSRVENGEYSSQVNYCPFCGAKAPEQAIEWRSWNDDGHGPTTPGSTATFP